MASLHPEHGARIVLSREAAGDDGATYRVTVYAPGGARYETRARIEGGRVAIEPWDSPPEAWIATFGGRLLDGLAKKHDGGDWPRKLTRWRQER